MPGSAIHRRRAQLRCLQILPCIEPSAQKPVRDDGGGALTGAKDDDIRLETVVLVTKDRDKNIRSRELLYRQQVFVGTIRIR